jgi:phage terminase large subunit-like protein
LRGGPPRFCPRCQLLSLLTENQVQPHAANEGAIELVVLQRSRPRRTPDWDLAATEKTELNDPDWTIGVKLGRDRNPGYWLLDVVCARANPGALKN